MIDDLLRPTPSGPRPPVDGFVAAVRSARGRRWRTLRNAAACGTAAVATAVVAVTPRLSAGPVAGLEPTAPHVATTSAPARPDPTTTPLPTPSVDAVGSTPHPDGPAVPYGGTVPDAGPYVGHAPVAPGGAPRASGHGHPEPTPWPSATEPESPAEPAPPAPTQPPETSRPPDPEPTTAPPTEPTPEPTRGPSHDPVDLSFEGQGVHDCQAATWCVTSQVSARSDGARTLRLRACRAASDTSGVLTFRHENEVDFRITRDGRVVWQWSTVEGADPEYAHDVAVGRWECAVWTTTWYRNDLNGDRAAAGRYELGALPRATNLSARWYQASFDLT